MSKLTSNAPYKLIVVVLLTAFFVMALFATLGMSLKQVLWSGFGVMALVFLFGSSDFREKPSN